MKDLKKGSLNFLNLVEKPNQKRKLLFALDKVLSSGNFILGEEVRKFESEFAEYLGTPFCIGVGNGLEALQIALMALGIGKNDEVITTPISAVATTLAIMMVGAKPIFVDTDINGLLDTNKIEKAITKKTKVLLPVHLYGNPVNPLDLRKICKKNRLFLIEDAAQAHGSSFMGKKLGTYGDLGCFSFYPTKNLGAIGDGGAIVTKNKRLARICREIRDYGQRKKYLHIRFGLNSRLDELQAAFLRIRLVDLDKENDKRKELAQRYINKLSQIDEIDILEPTNFDEANFHLFVIRTKRRDALSRYLNSINIQTHTHYPLIIPNQPFLRNIYVSDKLVVARNFVKEILSLPCHPKMGINTVDYISDEIIKFYKEQNKQEFKVDFENNV